MCAYLKAFDKDLSYCMGRKSAWQPEIILSQSHVKTEMKNIKAKYILFVG
jgi:hypothetical protein